ncbi:P-loop containing nucleoside triphosphate hydrolase protein [Dipodascopsis tothii]|uniref:P-loop containing nucleoside triphosphate hydrolase protein n=1 Tax=Dipodascopsis tothii TaxID=44089 RepID=UPI0034CD1DD2
MDTRIVASCQQTRFHLVTESQRSELDIDGLSLSLERLTTEEGGVKLRGAKRSSDTKLLVDANLKLKPGTKYCLTGSNGAGKSTLLRSISEKLIAGVPQSMRIAALLQTTARTSEQNGVNAEHGEINSAKLHLPDETMPVLKYVQACDTFRADLVRQQDALHQALVSSDPVALVRAHRAIKHGKMMHSLERIQQLAQLRSGSRGLQARKALLQAEKEAAESAAQLEGDVDADAPEFDIWYNQAVDAIAVVDEQLEARPARQIAENATEMLEHLGFSDARKQQTFETLSGGWKMRALLAATLIQSCDLLILDEPTNYLDIRGILWLESYLQELEGPTVLVVSHDRDFVDNICEELVLVKDFKLEYFPGNLSFYEEELEKKKIHLEKLKENETKQVDRLRKTIQTNKQVGKATGDDNKLRQAKSRQKKLENRTGVETSAKGTRFKRSRDLAGFHLTARAEIEVIVDEVHRKIQIPPPAELKMPGSLVAVEHASVRYKGAEQDTLADVSLTVFPRDRLGLVGRNGCGKSTLLKLIMRQFRPSRGTVEHHPRLKIGYYSQHRTDELIELGSRDPGATALQLVRSGTEMDEQAARTLLSGLGLVGRTASDTAVGVLSGGQLVRLGLALELRSNPHLLVLDEVTTHLDYHTIEALAEALKSYEGAVILATHDRHFIRAVVEESEDVEGSRHAVYRIFKGGLRVQTDGISGFEQDVRRRLNG